MAKIDIIGAGAAGMWQAFLLSRLGHKVTLYDPAGTPSQNCASGCAGGMLGSYCEGEPGHEEARDLGLEAMEIWKEHYPYLKLNGTLVVASPRDVADLQRFAAVTQGHTRVGVDEISALEPALEDRFRDGLFYKDEGHIEPFVALEYFIKEAAAQGTKLVAEAWEETNADVVIDCRGLAARDHLKTLRGVRGERVVVDCPGVTLSRPVRMTHPRIPFYIVPWSDHQFMIGTTAIESDDRGPATLRSVTEIMAAAYALIPALGEARIAFMDADVRPSFPDNAPKIILGETPSGRPRIYVNGLFRHGFLLSPILAKITADYIESGAKAPGVVLEDHGEW